MSVVHILPIADLVDHEDTGSDCICGPSTETVRGDDGYIGWLVKHHSLDGREARE